MNELVTDVPMWVYAMGVLSAGLIGAAVWAWDWMFSPINEETVHRLDT